MSLSASRMRRSVLATRRDGRKLTEGRCGGCDKQETKHSSLLRTIYGSGQPTDCVSHVNHITGTSDDIEAESMHPMKLLDRSAPSIRTMKAGRGAHSAERATARIQARHSQATRDWNGDEALQNLMLKVFRYLENCRGCFVNTAFALRHGGLPSKGNRCSSPHTTSAPSKD